jgi:hypothetical protein
MQLILASLGLARPNWTLTGSFNPDSTSLDILSRQCSVALADNQPALSVTKQTG